MQEEAQRTNLSAEEQAERQKDLLRDMIDQQLLLSRGKELDINADADVIRRLDEIRKQNKFDTMEDLEKAVRQSGISYEDFKANIKNSIITQKVVGQEVGQTLRLTAKQEQAYYEAAQAGVRTAGAGAAERDPGADAGGRDRCSRLRRPSPERMTWRRS